MLRHAHGTLSVEGSEVRNHLAGKNALTRKEWEREESVLIADLAWVLVQSHDRLNYRLDTTDATGRMVLSAEGITSLADLRTFLGELWSENKAMTIALAHPSYGLVDPVHEGMARAARAAMTFNASEDERRRKALGARPEVKVKVYDTHKDYAKDAPKMARAGWMPDSQVSDRGKASLLGTAGKVVFTGGLGLITGLSRKNSKLTVTWIKQPPGFVPQDYREVPEIPEARTFPYEYFFRARLLDPVQPGHEFDVGGPAAEVAAPAQLTAPSESQKEIEATVQPPAQNPLGPAEKLRQLAALRDDGLITSEEFEAKKAEILAQF